jgi:hypothetical protein
MNGTGKEEDIDNCVCVCVCVCVRAWVCVCVCVCVCMCTYLLSVFPERMAATVRAHAPVPQARVGPAPLSHTFMRRRLGAMTCVLCVRVCVWMRESGGGERERERESE